MPKSKTMGWLLNNHLHGNEKERIFRKEKPAGTGNQVLHTMVLLKRV